jgi:methylphosphotriester-DNA--protein-cysteine methyltransferase
MTYDAPSLADLVRRCLEAAPLTPLSAISQASRIDRHTLTRALREVHGLTFREMRADILRRRVASVKTADPPRSVKEIAFELGYRAANSLSRQRRGVNGRRPTSPPSRGKDRQGRS